MDAKEWRKEKKLNRAEVSRMLAEIIGENVPYNSIAAWEEKISEPRASIVAAYETISKGRVKAKDWLK